MAFCLPASGITGNSIPIMETKRRFTKYVEILDTTLRDGEQTPGVAFTPQEKLQIARLLLTKLHVDRMEIGSARVSEGEREGVAAIIQWAESRGLAERLEILGFVDAGKSVDWIRFAGGHVINLLTKGSERHCRVQLAKTPEEHYNDVVKAIEYAVQNDLRVNVYLEDWSGGMRESFCYVYNFIKILEQLPVERIMLPDTLGLLAPDEVTRYLEWLFADFPDLRFDFHGHNDYGLVTANSLAAVKAGINGVHTTVNGLGERTGNQPLAPLVVAIADLSDRYCHVSERQLLHATCIVQQLSGKRLSWNAPVVGSDVFTQTCGVHADGDKKGNLYSNDLLPERFSRKRNYALGKLSGKASLDKNLEELGMELGQEVRAKVLQEIVRLGDKKKQVTPADLPFIISGVLRTPIEGRVKVKSFEIITHSEMLPKARVVIECQGKELTAEASGDGGYDAFVKALRKALKTENISLPRLRDYEVRIPPGGKTDALVETTISWDTGAVPLVTTAVDTDQLAAAVKATEKMMNVVIS